MFIKVQILIPFWQHNEEVAVSSFLKLPMAWAWCSSLNLVLSLGFRLQCCRLHPPELRASHLPGVVVEGGDGVSYEGAGGASAASLEPRYLPCHLSEQT